MKYDTMFKFTTDNSVMWVSVFLARGGKNLGTYCVTCDELAEWLLEREKETKIIEKMLAVKEASDNQTALISCQGQAMDGYSELANYRYILEEYIKKREKTE